jgi:hypothetical protein
VSEPLTTFCHGDPSIIPCSPNILFLEGLVDPSKY